MLKEGASSSESCSESLAPEGAVNERLLHGEPLLFCTEDESFCEGQRNGDAGLRPLCVHFDCTANCQAI